MEQAELIRWAEALESGAYKQGEEWLRPTDDTYCCLGVACILRGAEVETRGFTEPSSLGEDLGLPPGVEDLLVCMNDDDWGDSAVWLFFQCYGVERRKHTFAEIAAFIREHLVD